MTVWRVGMLAVCVDGSPMKIIEGHPELPNGMWIPEKDQIGRVISIVEDSIGLGLIGLQLEGNLGGISSRFRPAVQDWQSETQSKTSELDDMLKGRIPAL